MLAQVEAVVAVRTAGHAKGGAWDLIVKVQGGAEEQWFFLALLSGHYVGS